MNRYGITTDGMDADRLRRAWRWLIPPRHRVLLGTALGDLFLANEQDRIVRLNVGEGTLEPAADSLEAFRAAWEDDDQRGFWFGPSLVDAIEAAGGSRGLDECYSYLVLPVLGGTFEPTNFKTRPLQSHLDGWGPIHEQIRELPDGTTCQLVVEP